MKTSHIPEAGSSILSLNGSAYLIYFLLSRPSVRDNASVHRANCVQARQVEWARRGLRLKFLPDYSGELNLVEQF